MMPTVFSALRNSAILFAIPFFTAMSFAADTRTASGAKDAASKSASKNGADQKQPAEPLTQYRIVTKPAKQLTITIAQPVEGSIFGVFYPVPPNTECQRVVSAELIVQTAQGTLKGARGIDAGQLRKPLMGVAIRGPVQGKAIVKLEMDFFDADMKPVTADEESQADQQPVVPLSPLMRPLYIKPESYYEYNTPSFVAWMKANNLVRGPKERDVDFAIRVSKHIQQNFTYKIHSGEFMDQRQKELATDRLGVLCTEKSAECWGLSQIYTSTLRANGVPCRQVSGYMLKDGAEREGGHHVRGEAYLEGIGWVLAELAGSTSGKKRDVLRYLGHGSDDMCIISQGINYKVPGPRGAGSVGTMSGFGIVTADGQWSFPKGEWKIEERKVEEKKEDVKGAKGDGKKSGK
jgi:hypothetical protein